MHSKLLKAPRYPILASIGYLVKKSTLPQKVNITTFPQNSITDFWHSVLAL
ncbi:hypothetical protein [Pollutibacter soli]|uniref:hypothetical protein n=1 Tax=Pollutibacter soli TaxID=3034157 RepID=UPI0030139B9A